MAGTAVAVQRTFDELGTPLRDVTFVVVDLETTGGSARDCSITEIGAVKVRGGERLGEFQTLVNPQAAIPPFIAVLTGITDAMVASAPRIESALPAFLEFARGCVLVAHNAPFDLGFLKANAERMGVAWPSFASVDTARLARRVLTRDDARDCRLATLARLFRATTEPCHRALADARATVDVLHGLLERLGNLGVQTLEELHSFTSMVTAEQRRKRHLADPLPHRPGVYLFRDHSGRVLYIGKSKDLRSRVRQYFVASEPRTRMAEMVGIATHVDYVECSHALEAEVRELRLIAEHKPRYNRRSRFPERSVFVKLTAERYPRLSLVRKVVDDGAVYLGPFGSARTAEVAVAAAHEAFRLRQCTQRISKKSSSPTCVLYEMGRCGGPCAGLEDERSYAEHVVAARLAIEADPEVLLTALRARMSACARDQRFEDAAVHRDRMAVFVRAAARTQRLVALGGCAQLVAARRRTRAGVDDGWDVIVVRHGRLAAAGAVPPGVPPRPAIDALVLAAEPVTPGPGPLPAATAEEMQVILRWLDEPGTRLVDLDGTWASPARGAARLLGWLDTATGAQVVPFDDRRGLRPQSRPARATG